MTKEKLVLDITNIFKTAKTWNNGKFAQGVEQYAKENNLNVKQIHKTLGKAFEYYLAGNQESEIYIESGLKKDYDKIIVVSNYI